MIANKILGYALLIIGLIIIFGAMWQSYSIFTAKDSVPLVFIVPAPIQQKRGGAQDSQAMINEAVKAQLNQIISPESITKILNLGAWSIFAGILILGGGVISGIGVKLVNGKQ